jgi:hypothetical protein
VRRRSARLIALLGAAAAAALLTAPAASATFHLMKIREISPGTDGQDDSFVEVQMYAQLQNFLSGGAALLVCNTGCTPTPVTFSPFTDVAHGNSQDTVVFGDSGVASASKDFNVNLNLDQNKAGGAVCYLSEPGFHDCVAWGTFSAASKLTGTYGSAADPGTPAAALTSGMALRRSIQAGCPTLLEASDDTNNSAADFSAVAPNPRPNSVAPSETPCSPAGGGPAGYPPASPVPKKKKCKKAKKRAVAAKKKCKKRRR